MVELKRVGNETEEQCIWRLGNAKDAGLADIGWEEIADVINKAFRDSEDEYRDESAYRKPYQSAKKYYEGGVFNKFDEDSYVKRLNDAKHEVRKERQKLFDERVGLNKELREQGRREQMIEIVKRAVDEVELPKYEPSKPKNEKSENDFIIHLTDVHCGMTVDNVFNKYDPEILRQRLNKYGEEIAKLATIFKPENAYVILGGDMIHGLIHVNSRIESKENVVEQVMIVSSLVSEFIKGLSDIFTKVNIYTTAGNHARLTPDKEETSHGENLDLLVPYISQKELQNVKNVEFYANYLDFDIATFKVRGYTIYAAHGDKDNAKSVVYNMTKFARKAGTDLPDMCFLGHRHTNGLTTVDDVKVIESGSVGGMDNYCLDERLVGTPEQIVVVCSKENMLKALCDIQL